MADILGQLFGMQQPQDQGLVQSILSQRFQPLPEDAAQATYQTAYGAAPVSPYTAQQQRLQVPMAVATNLGNLQEQGAKTQEFNLKNQMTEFQMPYMQNIFRELYAGGQAPADNNAPPLPFNAQPNTSGTNDNTPPVGFNTPNAPAPKQIDPRIRKAELAAASGNKALSESFMAEYNADPSVIEQKKTIETTAAERSKTNVTREAGYTKAQSALQGFEQQANLVKKNIDDALGVINKTGSMATGYGQAFSSLPNTDSRELNNFLSTIKANVGFDKLQQMRDSSPTGGALGQISNYEDKLLQAVNGALDPMQSNQLVANLQQIRVLYPQVLAEKKRAFQQDYSNYQPSGGNKQGPPAAVTLGPQPPQAPSQGEETKTINGQSFIKRNGTWYHQ